MSSDPTGDPQPQLGLSKKEQVLEQIRREIFSRKRKPGSIISAKGLAKDLGISRTPVREAMESLANAGLIQWVGVSGAVIRNVGEDELFEILRLRAAIDTEVGQTLACHFNPRHLRTLKAALEQMRVLAGGVTNDPESWDEFYELDMNFHKTMIRLAGMSRAEALIDNLMDHLRLFASARVNPVESIIDEHENILNAIEACKDGYSLHASDWVQEAVRDHMRGTAGRWSKAILKRLNEQWPQRKKEDSPSASQPKPSRSKKRD